MGGGHGIIYALFICLEWLFNKVINIYWRSLNGESHRVSLSRALKGDKTSREKFSGQKNFHNLRPRSLMNCRTTFSSRNAKSRQTAVKYPAESTKESSKSTRLGNGISGFRNEILSETQLKKRFGSQLRVKLLWQEFLTGWVVKRSAESKKLSLTLRWVRRVDLQSERDERVSLNGEN